MPQKEWNKDAPDLSVMGLSERESPIAAHFSKPRVQYIGSTSCCGCDFPHLMYQNGDWPWFDDGDPHPEQDAHDRYNREGLVDLLRATGEETLDTRSLFSAQRTGVSRGPSDLISDRSVSHIRLRAEVTQGYRTHKSPVPS
jgi:hypothetical protein